MRTLMVAALCLSVFTAELAAGEVPRLVPNTTKYKDAGAKPATGRSGSASLEVRALRGQNKTDVEITTGQLDSSSTPPGKLDKVQIKVLGAKGTLIANDNYKKTAQPGGYAKYSYDWAARNLGVQVQANVSGIDGSRNDVVTVSTTVKLRPDLTVRNLQNPRVAQINQPVVISAIVAELNRDTGARANCALKVDGVVVDAAHGIWIDAGDSVACEFTQIFHSTGIKQIEVEATSVAPADYDTSNNSVSGSIEILGAGVPIRYVMSAEDMTRDTVNGEHHYESYHYDDQPEMDYTLETTSQTESSERMVTYQANMSFDDAVTFPLRVESSLTSDGQLALHDSQEMDVTASFGDSTSQTNCGIIYDLANGRTLQVCSTRFTAGGGKTSVETWTKSRLLVYYSSYTSAYRDYLGDDVYTTSFTNLYPVGQQPVPELGNHISVRASIIDANGVNDAEAAVSLVVVNDEVTPFSEQCDSWDESNGDTHGNGYNCSSASFRYFGRKGFAQGIANQ
jgi:hypothetical protein